MNTKWMTDDYWHVTDQTPFFQAVTISRSVVIEWWCCHRMSTIFVSVDGIRYQWGCLRTRQTQQPCATCSHTLILVSQDAPWLHTAQDTHVDLTVHRYRLVVWTQISVTNTCVNVWHWKYWGQVLRNENMDYIFSSNFNSLLKHVLAFGWRPAAALHSVYESATVYWKHKK